VIYHRFLYPDPKDICREETAFAEEKNPITPWRIWESFLSAWEKDIESTQKARILLETKILKYFICRRIIMRNPKIGAGVGADKQAPRSLSEIDWDSSHRKAEDCSVGGVCSY
jgi:hypothetical protein